MTSVCSPVTYLFSSVREKNILGSFQLNLKVGLAILANFNHKLSSGYTCHVLMCFQGGLV